MRKSYTLVDGASVTDRDMADRVTALVWATRVAWVALGPAGLVAFGEALDGRSGAVQAVAAAGLWLSWGVALVALLALSTASVTVLRLVIPAAIPAVAVAALTGASVPISAVTAALALVATLGALSAEVGEAAVQASAYGAERRLPLRPPAPMVGPMVLLWAVLVAAAGAGPLLAASGRWLVGAPLSALAVGLGVVLGPRFHRLSRRWLVLVPAGLVVHDQVVLAETVMVGRQQVAAVRLAPADTDALDLTGVTWGTPLEIELFDQTMVVPSSLADPRGDPGPVAPVSTTKVLVSPSRPGRALRALGERRLPVG